MLRLQRHLWGQIVLQTYQGGLPLEHFDQIESYVNPFDEFDSEFHRHIGSFVRHSCSDFQDYFQAVPEDVQSHFIVWPAVLSEVAS
jgi:hypothetical protein